MMNKAKSWKRYQNLMNGISYQTGCKLVITFGFMVLFNINTGVSLSAYQSRMTLLFHLIKKRWMLGPKIPENLLLFDSSATSLNSTHVVFIGAKKTTKDEIAYFFNQDLQTYVVVQFNMIWHFFFICYFQNSYQSMRDQPYLAVMFNFDTKVWSYLPDLPIITHMDNSFATSQDCNLLAPLSTIVYTDKGGNRYL